MLIIIQCVFTNHENVLFEIVALTQSERSYIALEIFREEVIVKALLNQFCLILKDSTVVYF